MASIPAGWASSLLCSALLRFSDAAAKSVATASLSLLRACLQRPLLIIRYLVIPSSSPTRPRARACAGSSGLIRHRARSPSRGDPCSAPALSLSLLLRYLIHCSIRMPRPTSAQILVSRSRESAPTPPHPSSPPRTFLAVAVPALAPPSLPEVALSGITLNLPPNRPVNSNKQWRSTPPKSRRLRSLQWLLPPQHRPSHPRRCRPAVRPQVPCSPSDRVTERQEGRKSVTFAQGPSPDSLHLPIRSLDPLSPSSPPARFRAKMMAY